MTPDVGSGSVPGSSRGESVPDEDVGSLVIRLCEYECVVKDQTSAVVMKME